MIAERASSCKPRAGVVVVFMMTALLLVARGPLVTTDVGFTGTAFRASDSQGPSFSLGWMPDSQDLIPGNEPVNLTLRLVVGVTDQDGVDSVIGSYKNISQTTWTNVTLHEDSSYSEPYVYSANVNYTSPAGRFLYIWQYFFYASDGLGNWNKSEMRNISVSRLFALDGFNDMMMYGAGSAMLGLGIVAAALWYDRRKK